MAAAFSAQGMARLELAGLVESDGQGQGQVPLLVALADRLGQRLGLGELGRGGLTAVFAGLGQELDEGGQAGRVVGDGLEAGLQGGDGLVAVAAEHLDRGALVIGGGEGGLLLDRGGQECDRLGPAGRHLAVGAGLLGQRPGLEEQGVGLVLVDVEDKLGLTERLVGLAQLQAGLSQPDADTLLPWIPLKRLGVRTRHLAGSSLGGVE